MWTKVSIRTKLLLVLVLVAVVSAGVSSLIGYQVARQSLEQQSYNQLTATREMKANQVEAYFQQTRDQVITLSENRMTIDAIREFRDAFRRLDAESEFPADQTTRADRELQQYYEREFFSRLEANTKRRPVLNDYWPTDRVTRLLQRRYISGNPFDTGSKHLLDQANDGSTYSTIHGKFHPFFRDFLQRFGYYDIFLVDSSSGHILYSVFKEVDFGTSLFNGPYRDSNIAGAFRTVRGGAPHSAFLVDFKPYGPSYEAYASFIASPVYDGEEELGTLIFQMPVNRMNDIMTSNQEWSDVGLGQTGETYIVGADFTLRSESRFLIEDPESYLQQLRSLGVPSATTNKIAANNSSIGLQEVRTSGSLAAHKGESGTHSLIDYRGASVLSSYRPLQIPDVQWVIMSEMDEAEAFAPIVTLRNRLVLCLLILIGLNILLAAVFSRSLTRPLKALAATAGALARGDLSVSVDARGGDEIGELAASFEHMRDSLNNLLRRQEESIDALSTPLIPLHEQIMIMPLIGELDDRRLTRVRESLIEGLHASTARVAIVDITGVPALDQTVATGLARAVRVARLLGAKVIITGIQPALASTLVDLDLDLADVRAESSLQRGIEVAMAELDLPR